MIAQNRWPAILHGQSEQADDGAGVRSWAEKGAVVQIAQSSTPSTFGEFANVMSTRHQQAQREAIWVGVLGTLIVVTVYAVGGLDWLERKTLDWRFLYANSTPQHDGLVCIDIDDEALMLIRRWPWPRDIQAGVLDVLREAGLRKLLYDVELSEPEPVRSLTPRHVDIASDPLSLQHDLGVAFPDHELRLVLEAIGWAYVAFHYEQVPDDKLREGSLEMRVWRFVETRPDLWSLAPEVLFERVFTEIADADAGQLERSIVALRDVLSYAATVLPEFCPLDRVAFATPSVPAIAPVYFPHARAARRCGFVVFEPDDDGVMRRVPLLVASEGRVLPQLAFAVAFDELGLTRDDISATPGYLHLHTDPPLRIQVDERGRALVPWVPVRDWTQQFGQHVPIGVPWVVLDRRLKQQANEREIEAALTTLLEAGAASQWQQYRDDLRRVDALRSELRLARYRGQDEDVAQRKDWLRQYDAVFAEETPKLRDWVHTRLAALEAAGSGARPTALEAIRNALRANFEYAVEIDETLDWLRERVAGKIGLVGYTATALADMTPTPTSPRAPGVVAHANLLNGLLTGRTVSWASAWLNMLTAVVLGVFSTFVSVRWGPRVVFFVLVLLVGYVAIAGGLAFYAWNYWIALTPAVLAAVVSYVAVVVHRYLFLERESRQIAQALSQYTSATLARQMAEDAELCKRAEMREVSAMFTDLAGFTTISERIGAERTQRVLNVSLGRFSDVMLRYEGMINKFIGDGIFAFWNPVIYPQDDHAIRACEAAIDLQTGLRDLITEQEQANGDEVFCQLVLRIGVATGQAIVGPCGSEQKYDYTCIGDSVNVAARLESANKFYGTRTLVSGATLDRAGERFVVRSLGGVRVKGKTQAVPIYELLGREGDVPAESREYAERFGTAVACFTQRDWSRARTRFEQCLSERDDDLAARQYLAAIERFMAAAPGDDWTGALELTEK